VDFGERFVLWTALWCIRCGTDGCRLESNFSPLVVLTLTKLNGNTQSPVSSRLLWTLGAHDCRTIPPFLRILGQQGRMVFYHVTLEKKLGSKSPRIFKKPFAKSTHRFLSLLELFPYNILLSFPFGWRLKWGPSNFFRRSQTKAIWTSIWSHQPLFSAFFRVWKLFMIFSALVAASEADGETFHFGWFLFGGWRISHSN